MVRILALPSLAALVLAPALAVAQPAGNPNYNPPPPKEGYSYPDCFCTGSKGERVELGQTTCLTIGSKRVLARCEMSVNNPSWKRIGEGCPGV